ncbi:MAG: aminotransferase class V-fold PLP-dependent enzyme [bacterium]|nr:aminotransferase class V-fold PLP-dependent enzyme [bacterium]
MTEGFAADFGDFDGRVWLNCAHQGPLPTVAADEAREAVVWKTSPHELTTERFSAVPQRLREALGALLGVPADDVILGNSASYGMHLLANGLPLEAGDEVLLMQGDFPSNLLPWTGLEARGVGVRFLEPRDRMLQPDEVAQGIGPATRVLCLSWVHSFSGRVAQIEAIGRICRERGVRFVVNGSQAVGARPIDLSRSPVDALLGVGFKWLCGPYGTGYCWIRPELRETLRYNQRYWLSMQTADDLKGGSGKLEADRDVGARRYDVFGTANFFNFKTWAASIEYLLRQGIDRIAEHDRALVDRFVDGLDAAGYRSLAPRDPADRSTLVFFTNRDPQRNAEVYEHLRARGVDVAQRAGSLRAAPHLYNTPAQIDRALKALASL